ncbi:MAG: hypothetical protein WBG58_01755 [Ignavibacteriaceae bacterium]
MFEKEIKFISDFSLNKLKSLGSFVTFEKISTTDLHPAIILYISAELDYMIFRDRKKLLEDSIFDYSGREIADHFNVIAEELKQTKKISFSDIEKLITQAVSFNINYVVRPKWSLTKLIYNDQDFVSVDDLQRMLNYLYYYDYVKNVLAAYISKRKVIQLTLTEFDLILSKIDRELFNSNSEELINNSLHSIADFFNIGGIDKNRISLQAVEIFLKEKNLMDHLLKLNHGIPDGSRKKYEINDLKKVLYATAPLKPDSISGYEPVQPDLEDDSSDILLQDIKKTDTIEESDEAKEQSSIEETEIVTEEKIKSRSVSDEIIDDEKDAENMIMDALEDELEKEMIDELLSIEEEFQNENKFPDEENSVSAIEEGTVKSEENEIEREEDSSDTDELLTFYEKELAGIEEDSSEVLNDADTQYVDTSAEAESLQKIEENLPEQTEESSEPDVTTDEELEPFEIKEELPETVEEDTFVKKDFDLSIFEDEEGDTIVDEIINRLSEVPEEENSRVAEASKNTGKKEEDNPLEKKIVEEMLEDYFKDDSKKEEEKDTKGTLIEEPDIVDDEKPSATTDEKMTLSNGENIFDTDLASSILAGSSFEDDISSMIDEIDEIIEKDASKIQKPVKGIEKQDIGESPVDEEFDFEEKTSIETPSVIQKIIEERIRNPIPKAEVPLRDKDLFSYLSRKEVKKIVSNVFQGDDEDFVTTIEKISECSTYKEATEILKGVFFTYRVNHYSKEGVILTNAVSHFFRQV